MRTSDLRAAMKAAIPDARVASTSADTWTVRLKSYRGKPIAAQEEAVRLARQWLARENKDGVRWIDTTDQPSRYGYSHEVPTEKKSPAQLDAEIAEAIAKGGH